MSHTHKISLLILILAASLSCNSRSNMVPAIVPSAEVAIEKGDTVTGKVIAIVDGDTYDILVSGTKTTKRVRMEGIDAPERGMPFYNVSKKHLAGLCFNKNVTLNVTGNDHHDRILANSYLDDGTDLSRRMVEAGLAWHFVKYSSDSILASLEQQARSRKLGLWIDENPTPPWENRRLHRNGVSTKEQYKGTLDSQR